MVGTELHLEAVDGVAEKCGHDACIGNDHVKGFAPCEQSVGTGAHALEAGEIELHQLETSAVSRSVLADLGGGSLCLLQIARCADDVCAMSGEGAGGFDTKSCGDAGNEDPLA